MSLMIYGKHREEKNYCGFDVNDNCFVDKLTYASLIPESMKEQAEKIIQEIKQEYPEHIFQLGEAWHLPNE